MRNIGLVKMFIQVKSTFARKCATRNGRLQLRTSLVLLSFCSVVGNSSCNLKIRLRFLLAI